MEFACFIVFYNMKETSTEPQAVYIVLYKMKGWAYWQNIDYFIIFYNM